MDRRHLPRTCALLIAGALTLPLLEPLAEACGMFYSVRTISPEKRPSLAREKVLLIHDAAAGRQHFVREIVFRKAEEPFGFVVPTPSLPEVAKVETTPFGKLRERFPFAPVTLSSSRGYGKGSGSGFGSGGSQSVEVIATEKVGSFTAFVLAASDAGALSKWLEDNQLSNSDETKAWLEHYVRMGFYYVAMRYDPPGNAKEADETLAAETIRISFATPVAYYPYFEPKTNLPGNKPRLLELWTVSNTRLIPVVLADGVGWQRPLKPGKQYTRRETLEASLVDELESLLPPGELVVQSFQDQKRTRAGYHDVLFASAEPRSFSPEELIALEPLLGILDPGLVGEGEPGEERSE